MSDTHGILDNAYKALETEKNIDVLIHLGDHIGDFEKIKYDVLNNNLKAASPNMTFYGVLGNTDDKKLGVEEKIIEIQGHKFLLTHGHKYNVKLTDDRIFYKGKELGVSTILFGHTHIYKNEEFESVKLLNPGSLSLPKGGNGPSYLLVTVDIATVSAEIKFI